MQTQPRKVQDGLQVQIRWRCSQVKQVEQITPCQDVKVSLGYSLLHAQLAVLLPVGHRAHCLTCSRLL